MKAINNWNDIQAAGSNERPGAGGYVCIIRKVTDDPEKEQLRIEYDIAEGPFKNYAADTAERSGWWPLDTVKSYKAKALPFFKAFTDAVEATNAGYKWNFDERTLVGKGVGIVLREEEYYNRSGQLKTRLKPYEFMAVARIRGGDFTVPERKVADQAQQTTSPFTDLGEDDGTLPF